MRALVTGGGGFLGQYIVEELLKDGASVRILARGNYEHLRKLGVETIQGDIQNINDVQKACQNMDAVFHTAAKVGVFGRYNNFYKTNVLGTQNVIDACRQNNVHRLIFTSSSSVTYSGLDQTNTEANLDYPKKYLSAYSQTKAIAEQMVLRSNGAELLTVSLRPHLIWGPRDKYIIPQLIHKAKTRRLWIVGNGENLTDITYVENAALAHVLAAHHLTPESPVCGKAYFITQGKPVVMWEWINHILTEMKLPPVTRHMPFGIAYALGALLEKIYGGLNLETEPPITRIVAQQLSTSHTYNISAAQKDFGYTVRVSTEEGVQRLLDYFNSI